MSSNTWVVHNTTIWFHLLKLVNCISYHELKIKNILKHLLIIVHVSFNIY